MPRIAIGDLSVDVEVPERFRCDFSTSGSLLAESEATNESFELSAITVQGGSAVDIVRARAAESGATLLRTATTSSRASRRRPSGSRAPASTCSWPR